MLILEAFGWAAIVGLIITIISRFIPNEKLEAFGLKAGKKISTFGRNKLGVKVWEKIEDFFVESFGAFLEGLHTGLRFDNEDEEKTAEKTETNPGKNPGNVRT
jgi:hypothetical protein